jgi:uncharacterized RDD family membrane protein YckC
MEQQSLLSETEFIPQIASVGKRFLNYLIDVFVFYIFIVFILVIFFTKSRMTYNDYLAYNSTSRKIIVNITAIILFFLLYSISEIMFKGRTIGKFITGTKAVNEDGTTITAKTALLRALFRMVPFEPFSILGGSPWHDKWSETFVIDIKKTRLNDLNEV